MGIPVGGPCRVLIDGARPGEGEGDASTVSVDVGEAYANPAADLDAATASSLLEK